MRLAETSLEFSLALNSTLCSITCYLKHYELTVTMTAYMLLKALRAD
jgi:hypothetical protein